MKRNPIQDIKRTTPSIHKTTHSVHPAHKKVVEKDETEIAIERPVVSFEEKIQSRSPILPRAREHRGLRGKTWLIVAGLVALCAGIYFLSLRYGHATVYVTPKKEAFTFTDQSFRALRASDSSVAFEVMIISDTVEKNITLNDSKQTSSKAVGTVILYNAYSTQAQKLSINTRLVDDTNNIYYTDKAITVPGYTTVKGKIVPGSVSVGITASVAGAKYNGEPRDFVLVGFKGTPKATKIYARSKGPITGGSTGLMYFPSPEQKGELQNLVNTELKSKLEKSIQAQIPPKYILFQDSIKFETSFNPDSVLSATAEAKIVATGSATAVILDQKTLEKNIVKTIDTGTTDAEIEQISVPELSNFVFKISDTTGLINKQTTVVNFSLTGNGTLSWKPDYEQVVNQLLGVNKKEVNTIFVKNKGIEKARLLLTPPWQKTLPKNPNYIKIKQE